MMEHGLTRLQSVYTNFRQMEFCVRDVQCIWLEIMAMLDYMEINDYSENDVLQLEDAIARFYTQSFFRFFGRAATIPARLP
jgi:hypothetical protein